MCYRDVYRIIVAANYRVWEKPQKKWHKIKRFVSWKVKTDQKVYREVERFKWNLKCKYVCEYVAIKTRMLKKKWLCTIWLCKIFKFSYICNINLSFSSDMLAVQLTLWLTNIFVMSSIHTMWAPKVNCYVRFIHKILK